MIKKNQQKNSKYSADSIKVLKGLEAVKKSGWALQFASDALKEDLEIVLEAVKQNGYALEYADESLKKDKDILIEATKENDYVLKFIGIASEK